MVAGLPESWNSEVKSSCSCSARSSVGHSASRSNSAQTIFVCVQTLPSACHCASCWQTAIARAHGWPSAQAKIRALVARVMSDHLFMLARGASANSVPSREGNGESPRDDSRPQFGKSCRILMACFEERGPLVHHKTMRRSKALRGRHNFFEETTRTALIPASTWIDASAIGSKSSSFAGCLFRSRWFG